MPIESERGCGYRQVGKLYLVGFGIPYVCDNLPYVLDECDCCGYAPPFSRNLQWINKTYIREHRGQRKDPHSDKIFGVCICPANCPICHPDANDLEKYALMWVGERYYTPKSFTLEAEKMGVSKAIPAIPKDLKLGETWVFLAHRKVMTHDGFDENGFSKGSEEKPAIFYGFIPKKVEMLIWEREATEEKIKELKEKGITPVIVPDGDEVHG